MVFIVKCFNANYGFCEILFIISNKIKTTICVFIKKSMIKI